MKRPLHIASPCERVIFLVKIITSHWLVVLSYPHPLTCGGRVCVYHVGQPHFGLLVSCVLDISPTHYIAQSSVCAQSRNARKTRTPRLRRHPHHHCSCRHQALHRPDVRLPHFPSLDVLRPICLCLVLHDCMQACIDPGAEQGCST